MPIISATSDKHVFWENLIRWFQVVKTAADLVHRFDKDKVMFVFGSYTIGKERLYLSVAEHLGLKVSVDKPKYDILQCFEWPEVDKYVELRSKDATIFVKPMQEVNTDSLRKFCSKMTGSRRFSHVVGFVPTGVIATKFGFQYFSHSMFLFFQEQRPRK